MLPIQTLTLPGLTKVIELFGGIGVILAAIWAVFKWLRSIREANISREIEAKKPFLSLQLTLYQEVVELSSLIANNDGDKEANKAELFKLYYGKLALVESKGVETAMVLLKDAIDNKLKEEPKNQNQRIKDCALGLAHQCRDSLDKSWGINAWSNRL